MTPLWFWDDGKLPYGFWWIGYQVGPYLYLGSLHKHSYWDYPHAHWMPVSNSYLSIGIH